MFEIPEKIRTLPEDPLLPVKKQDLLEALIAAELKAWKTAIEPRMQKIRMSTLGQDQMKAGVDFFTEADVESERVIKEELDTRFGANLFRIFGEEEDAYSGNLDSKITIRIDPIDGTATFKFGTPTWSIMMGAYVGREGNEEQILSATYFPEYYEEILFRVDDVGVYVGNVRTGAVTEYESIERQDVLKNVLVMEHKNNVFSRRGNINEVLGAIEQRGIRIRSTSPAAAKEALETKGRRAFIVQGDYTQVDFIAYSALVSLGYQVYGFDGKEWNIDDPALSDKNFVLLPPGKAGEEILHIMKKYSL